MSYAAKWYNTDITKKIVTHQMKNHIHLLRWRDYKETWLDVGCAEGSVTKQILYPYIENRIEKLIAIDKLDGMIQFAKEHNCAEKIYYQTMDIMDDKEIENIKNQFDHVFSSVVAHLIPDTRTFLSGIYKVLKKHGQMFGMTVVDNFYTRALLEQYNDLKWSKYKPQVPVFAEFTQNPVAHLSYLLQDVGFKVDGCEIEKMSSKIDNIKDYVRALAEMYQNLGVIPAELFEDFVEDLVQRCRNQSSYLGVFDSYEIDYEVLMWVVTKTY